MPRIHITDDDGHSLVAFEIREDTEALWGHDLQAHLPNLVSALGQLFAEQRKRS